MQFAAPIPGYCPKGDWPGTKPLDPAQIAACLKAGWHQPTTTAVSTAHSTGPWIALTVVVAIALWIYFKVKSRGRSGAAVPVKP
jgi:hypothetical protein